MRVEIFVKSYNRPHCLGRLLTSLAHQGPSDLCIERICLFQDGPAGSRRAEDAERVTACLTAFRDSFPHGEPLAAARNLGPNGNCQRVWEAIAQSQSDAVLVFEDDLELSPYYLPVMAKLLRHAQGHPEVAMVSAHGMLGASPRTQQRRARALVPMAYIWGVHRWGWGATRQTLAELTPLVLAYFAIAKRIDFQSDGVNLEEARRVIGAWFHAQGFHQDRVMPGYDAAYDFAAFCTGRYHLNSYGSFAKSTGVEGVSFSERSFKAYNYHRTRMMAEAPDDFAWYDAALSAQVLALVRRFHASQAVARVAAVQGSNPPWPPLSRPQLIKTLYEQLFGWPLRDEDLVAHRIHRLCPRADQIPGHHDLLMPFAGPPPAFDLAYAA